MEGKKSCQCPEWGDPHFYAESKLSDLLDVINCVNALKGATLISTWPQKGKREAEKQGCVNALKGATLISTLASGNPHK